MTSLRSTERGHICARACLDLMPRGNAADQGSKEGEEDAQDGNAQYGYARILDAEHGKLAIALCDAILVERVRLGRGCIWRRGAIEDVVYRQIASANGEGKENKEGVTGRDEDERETEFLCKHCELRRHDGV